MNNEALKVLHQLKCFSDDPCSFIEFDNMLLTIEILIFIISATLGSYSIYKSFTKATSSNKLDDNVQLSSSFQQFLKKAIETEEKPSNSFKLYFISKTLLTYFNIAVLLNSLLHLSFIQYFIKYASFENNNEALIERNQIVDAYQGPKIITFILAFVLLNIVNFAISLQSFKFFNFFKKFSFLFVSNVLLFIFSCLMNKFIFIRITLKFNAFIYSLTSLCVFVVLVYTISIYYQKISK